jgi:hypothetical protein
MKTKNILCGLAGAVVLQLGMLAGSAQTYIYTYTGNDFTSASGPYTTSDNITANLVLSAPLGANYEGSPTATLLNFGINDGVYQDLPELPNMYVANFTFGTDSSGDIVSWDFAMIGFHEYLNPVQSVTMITIDQPGDVMDSTSIDTPNGNIGAGSVPSDPGVWVETVVPEPSVGTLFVSLAALVLAFGRFRPSPPAPFRFRTVFPAHAMRTNFKPRKQNYE